MQAHTRFSGAPVGWASSRPHYSASDILQGLWRERLLIVITFIVMAIAGGAGAYFLIKPSYVAKAALLVRGNPEFTYLPRIGDAGHGVISRSDEMIQAETQLLLSDTVKRKLVEKLGLSAFGLPPSSGDGADPASEERAFAAITRGLKVETAPDAPTIKVSFTAASPETAQGMLDAIVDIYQQERRGVLSDPGAQDSDAQAKAFAAKLKNADARLASFLERNSVGDFVAAKTAYTKAYDQAVSDKFATESQLAGVRAGLKALQTRLQQVPGEISLQRDLDLTVPQKLLSLRTEREELLGRYQPDAQPVKEIELKIAQYEHLLTSGGGVGEKDRRLGVNTVAQDLKLELVNKQVEEATLSQRVATLDKQIAQATEKLQAMGPLESEYSALSSNRDVLEKSLHDVYAHAQENESLAQFGGQDDTVKVIERSPHALKAKDLRSLGVIGSGVLAIAIALFVGLLRVSLQQGYPSPDSAGRSLNLPVLATADHRWV